MSIWSRLDFLRVLFPDRAKAAEVSRRWMRARQRDPEMMGDIIRLGGIMAAQPFQAGEVSDLDPQRLAYEAGRRDLALQLTAMMGLTTNEMNSLIGDDDAY